MFGPFELDDVGSLLERVFGRATGHARWWIALWLAGLLVVTAIAAICHAPDIAYVVLLVVARVAVVADSRTGSGA